MTMDLQPGAFIRLAGRQDDTYQVVSLDDYSESCWVRRWPLPRGGSPVFAVPLDQVSDAFPAAA
jgi:hypothetical protein